MTEATEGHRCALGPRELEPEQFAETLARLRAQRASLALLEQLPSPARGAPSFKPRYDLGALPALASLRDLELQGAAFDDEALQPLLALAPLARLVLRKVSASALLLASLGRAQPALVVTA